jgi:hypothetical protein
MGYRYLSSLNNKGLGVVGVFGGCVHKVKSCEFAVF